MDIVLHRALAVIEKYHLHRPPRPHSLCHIYKIEGILLKFYPFRGSLSRTYIRTPDGIELYTVKSGLPPAELKSALAHGLGHSFLHGSPGTYIYGLTEEEVEDQADDFASLLLIPPGSLREGCRRDIQKLAEEFCVPLSLTQRRLQLEEWLIGRAVVNPAPELTEGGF